MDQLAAILPTDIVHHIVGYTGKLKLRNGKYMGQISKSDPRYVQLNTIPKPLDSIYNSRNFFARTVVFKGNTHSIRVAYSSYPRWRFSETNNYVKYSFRATRILNADLRRQKKYTRILAKFKIVGFLLVYKIG